MKRFFIIFFVFICFPVISLTENIRIAGHDFEYQKISESEYEVSIFKNIKIRLQGKIVNGKPELKAGITRNTINRIPGFNMLNKAGIKITEIIADSNGLGFRGEISPQGPIKTLLKFLNIARNFAISGTIQKSGITLNIMLIETKITLPAVLFLGTQIRFNSLSLRIASGIGSSFMPSIGVQGDGAIKPSKFDKFLKCVILAEFKIPAFTFSITINDTWEKPMGIPFGKATNAAVQMTLSHPTGISGIGFNISNAEVLGQRFSFLVSADMGRNAYAVIASANKVGANILIDILKKIGIPIPSALFPQAVHINNFTVHFAPTGGTVGTVQFNQGYLVKGDLKLAKIDFHFEGQADVKKARGSLLAKVKNLDFIQKQIVKAVRKIPVLKPVVKTIVNTLRLSEITVSAKGGTSNAVSLGIKGKVIALPINLNLTLSTGTINVKMIVSEIVKFIKDKAAAQIAKTVKKAVKGIQKAGSFAISKTKKSASGVLKFAANIATAPINAIRKLTEKYGPRAKKMRNWANKVLNQAGNETVKIVSEFLSEASREMNDITNPEVIAAFKQEWEKILADIRVKWQSILSDKTCRKFFKKAGNKNKGQREYQNKVQEFWKNISQQVLNHYNNAINRIDREFQNELRAGQNETGRWFRI